MKKTLLIVITGLMFWGCSSSIDTTNFSSEEKLKYAMELFNDEVYDQAINEFQSILLQFPGNAVVDDAQFYLAQARLKRKEYILAAYEFSKLLTTMTASEFVPEAQYMLAECYYLLSPAFALDQKYTRKSIEEFQAFIDFFPTNQKVQDAENKMAELYDKLAQKEYNSAKIYEHLEYYHASIIYYDRVIENYHDTKYAPVAMYDKIMLLIQRSKNKEAISEIDKFLKKYPSYPTVNELSQLKNSLQVKLSAN